MNTLQHEHVTWVWTRRIYVLMSIEKRYSPDNSASRISTPGFSSIQLHVNDIHPALVIVSPTCSRWPQPSPEKKITRWYENPFQVMISLSIRAIVPSIRSVKLLCFFIWTWYTTLTIKQRGNGNIWIVSTRCMEAFVTHSFKPADSLAAPVIKLGHQYWRPLRTRVTSMILL